MKKGGGQLGMIIALVSFSALTLLVGWVAGRASGPYKSSATCPKRLFLSDRCK